MASTLNTYTGFLKTVYGEYIDDLLGHDTVIMRLMGKSKAKVDAQTHQATLAWKVQEPIARGHRDGVLPAIQPSRAVQGTVTVARMYGRGQLDRILFKATKEMKAAFAEAADVEMDGVITQVRDLVNQLSIFGGQTRGFLCEQVASTVTPAFAQDSTDTATTTSTDTWLYDGDFSFIDGSGHHAGPAVDSTDQSTWVRIRLVRMDNYEGVTEVNTPANLNLLISDFDRAAGTIDITVGDDDALGGSGFTTLDILNDYAVAVLCHETQGQDSNNLPFGRIHDFSHDITGIFDWLGNDTMAETVDRSDATGEPVLQSWVMRSDIDEPGVRTAFDIERYMNAEDVALSGDPARLVERTNNRPSAVIVNHRQRSRYVGALNVTYNLNHGGGSKAPTAESGFSDVMIEGKRFITSSDMPNGIFLRLSPKCWKRLELGSPGFADEDGNMFSRVDGQDAYQFYYAWYLNQYCVRPKDNILICGYTL